MNPNFNVPGPAFNQVKVRVGVPKPQVRNPPGTGKKKNKNKQNKNKQANYNNRCLISAPTLRHPGPVQQILTSPGLIPGNVQPCYPIPSQNFQQTGNMKPWQGGPSFMAPVPAPAPERTGFNFNELPREIHMEVGSNIYLNLNSELIFHPGKTSYPAPILQKIDLWHQVVVHHEDSASQSEILSSLFEVVPDLEFFPIAYRHFFQYDTFLLTASDRGALEVLFQKNLYLKIYNKPKELKLSVRLGAGKITAGQMHPKTQLDIVVRDMLEKASLHGSHELNFENFSSQPAFREVAISLASVFHLNMVLQAFVSYESPILLIKCIRLSRCNLSKIEPLRLLGAFKNLELLDLSENRIYSVVELKILGKLSLKKLYVSRNPFMVEGSELKIHGQIRRLIPSLKSIDNVKIDNDPLLTVLTEQEESMDLPIINLLEGELVVPEKHDLASFRSSYRLSDYWHKVVVHHNGNLGRRDIVPKLLEVVENNDFYPCYYESRPRFDEFFVRNNFEALEVLLQNKLVIGTLGSDKQIFLHLRMNIAPFQVGQVDVPKKILSVVRDNYLNGNLYLHCLAEKEVFKNVVLDLSAPRTISQILLNASRKVGQFCTSLDLSNNGIVSGQGMYSLVWFPKLKNLDLSNNKIESFEKLAGCPQANKITSLKLHGNPLCAKNSLPQYISRAKTFFHELETLDGASLEGNPLLLSRQNFLARPESYTFVETFVRRFFRDYDTQSRALLKELYAPSAHFSISCHFDPSIRSKEYYLRVSKYMVKSRNVMKIVDMSLYTQNVFVGPEEILSTINQLHTTEHDFLSFNIDCPVFSADKILITVHGVYKDKPMTLLEDEILIFFTRTFFIRAINFGMGVFEQSCEYQIFNDVLYVTNATISQKNSAFSRHQFEATEPAEENESKEQQALLILFREMTNLNSLWCTKCLEEAKWNLKVALNICIKMLEDDKVPEDAFVHN